MYRSVDMMIKRLVLTLLFLCVGTSGLSAQEQAKPAKPAKKPGLQQRIDFGNAQILGQSIKSGAVYLMHRKKSDIKNMLEVRQNYREEIKEDFGLEKTAISQSAAEPKNISKQ
jgi:hypothetical protein